MHIPVKAQGERAPKCLKLKKQWLSVFACKIQIETLILFFFLKREKTVSMPILIIFTINI